MPRNLDQRRNARAIVHRSVINAVAVNRRADAQMVEMRPEDHIFILKHGVRAGQHADHILRFHLGQSSCALSRAGEYAAGNAAAAWP